MALDSKFATLVQPAPTNNENSVDVAVEAAKDLRGMGLEEVAQSIEARILLGERKYGSRLKSHNGRNAWTDSIQECLDLLNYSKQCEIEGLDDGTLFYLAAGLARYILTQMNRDRV